VPDPIFTGGFAGIQSTVAFDRVAVTFNSAATSVFALDNILIASVPEPSTLSLVLGSIIGWLFFTMVQQQALTMWSRAAEWTHLLLPENRAW
jgi:hypothetical protein